MVYWITDEVDDSLTRYVCNGEDGENGNGTGGFNAGLTGGFNNREVISYPEVQDFSDGSNIICSSGSGYNTSVDAQQYIPAYVTNLTAPIPSEKTIVISDLNSSKVEIDLRRGISGWNNCPKAFTKTVTVSFFNSDGEQINSSAEYISGQAYECGSNSYPPIPQPNEIQYFNIDSTQTFSYGQNGGYYNCSCSATNYHTNKIVFYLTEDAETIQINYQGDPVTFFGYIMEQRYYNICGYFLFQQINRIHTI